MTWRIVTRNFNSELYDTQTKFSQITILQEADKDGSLREGVNTARENIRDTDAI